MAEEKSMNLDPITNAPGAHPVGTGVGAMGGAAAGAAAGAFGGPVGAVVGGVVGAVAGGLGGKAVAESVCDFGRVQSSGEFFTGDVSDERRARATDP